MISKIKFFRWFSGNKLIMNKVKDILRGPLIMLIIKRAQELVGEDYSFVEQAKISKGGLLVDGVDRASREVPVEKLTRAFIDYFYAFLRLLQTLTSDLLMERGKL